MATNNVGNGQHSVSTQFKDVLEGCAPFFVNPRQCIPLCLVRKISVHGRNRLINSFLGRLSTHHFNSPAGIVAGPSPAQVVPLTGALQPLLLDYFKSMDLDAAEVKSRSSQFDSWFGVIDGCHRHSAIIMLMNSDPAWDGYQWQVNLLRGGFPLQRYKQMARIYNGLNAPIFHISLTLYDELKGLKDEWDREIAARNGQKPTSKEIAKSYDGSSHVSDSALIQTANTTFRLSHSVIDTIGEISNSERPDLCILMYKEKNHLVQDQVTEDEVSRNMDCRIYKKFITLHSIRGSRAFMNATATDKENGEFAQILTLHRAKEICRANNFKSVKNTSISEQFEIAIDAINEINKFKKFLDEEDWPDEMKPIRDNILRNPSFDNDIIENRGNDRHVLDKLLDFYQRLFPQKVGLKMKKFERSFQAEDENEDDIDVSVLTQSADLVTNNDFQTPTEIADNEFSPASVSKENESAIETLDVLNELQLSLYCKTWIQYENEVRTTGDRLFDLIISDLPFNHSPSANNPNRTYMTYMDDAALLEFSQHCKRMVKNGSYVVFFIHPRVFVRLSDALHKCGFMVMERPGSAIRSQEGLQGSRLSIFPQNNADFLLIAKYQGAHPQGFIPNFDGDFNELGQGTKRRFASLSNVPNPQNKLVVPGTRIQVRPEEKFIGLWKELILLYSMENAYVLVQYAGAMEAVLACMESNRACVALESAENCFQYAVDRCKLMATNIIETRSQQKKRRICDQKINTSAINPQFERDVISSEESESESDINGSSSDSSSDSDDSSDHSSSSQESTINHRIDSTKPRLIQHNQIQRGMRVSLIKNEIVVGSANLLVPNDDDILYVEKLHGTSLLKFQKKGEHLVVITNIIIGAEFCKDRYLYECPGQEESPDTLGDIYQKGLYAWDLKQMGTY